MVGTMPPTSCIVIDGNMIISSGRNMLEAILACPKVKLDIRETEDSLKYYLIMPNYYVIKEHLICNTAKDVNIERALEYKEIYDIMSHLGLGGARILN